MHNVAQIEQLAGQIVNNLGTPGILALKEVQDDSGADSDGGLSDGRGRDRILGGNDDDVIAVGDGRDILNGGESDDLMIGGGACDTILFEGAFGDDTVLKFEVGVDELEFAGQIEIETIETGNSALITSTGDAKGSVELLNVFNIELGPVLFGLD